jgi:hypothetical protein
LTSSDQHAIGHRKNKDKLRVLSGL